VRAGDRDKVTGAGLLGHRCVADMRHILRITHSHDPKHPTAGRRARRGRVDRVSTATCGNLIKIGRLGIEKTGPSARTHGHGVARP
jgi:hypothetical protein